MTKLISVSILVLSVAISASADNIPAPHVDSSELSETCLPDSDQIRVTVEGVSKEGLLTVELYEPSKRAFLKSASRLQRIRIPAQNGQQTVCFHEQPAGRYAVATYHDVDADHDLDQKWNGMPKEPFGLSTNPKLRFGFPKFENAAFDVSEGGTAITITLVR